MFYGLYFLWYKTKLGFYQRLHYHLHCPLYKQCPVPLIKLQKHRIYPEFFLITLRIEPWVCKCKNNFCAKSSGLSYVQEPQTLGFFFNPTLFEAIMSRTGNNFQLKMTKRCLNENSSRLKVDFLFKDRLEMKRNRNLLQVEHFKSLKKLSFKSFKRGR